MRIKVEILWEHFRALVMAEHAPEPGSAVALLMAEADELEARREALHPPHAEAAERTRKLERIVFAPIPALGLGANTPAGREWAKAAAELTEARAAEAVIAAQLSDLSRAVKTRQKEIMSLLGAPAVSERAITSARESVLKRMR